jgi:hypothetical protein
MSLSSFSLNIKNDINKTLKRDLVAMVEERLLIICKPNSRDARNIKLNLSLSWHGTCIYFSVEVRTHVF